MAAVHVGMCWRRLVFSVAGGLFPLPHDCFVSVLNAKGYVPRLGQLVLVTSSQWLDVT